MRVCVCVCYESDSVSVSETVCVMSECVSVSSPLVKGTGALLGQHGPGAVDGAAILTWRRVHVARLHHIHRRRYYRGDEARSERRHEMTRQIVYQKR